MVDEPPIVRVGDVFAGKYRVERVLGTGGMGVVFGARHLQLETPVAIKCLLPAMAGRKEVVERFAREARAAARMTTEHVARVYDVGIRDDGGPYIVMEFLDGIDLARWLKEHGRLPVELAADFILQACVALAEAHGMGIVHRDIKPANLFATRRPDGRDVIKVLDFGISKLSAALPTNVVTQTANVMGSPLYMSPEHMSSPKGVDAQTDIWALGVVLYELLVGRPPFEGETLPEVSIKVATAAPPSIRARRAEVPQGLEVVVMKCLEKSRQARYKTIREFAIALLEFAPPRARPSFDLILALSKSQGETPPPPALRDAGSTIAVPIDTTAAPLGTTLRSSPRRRALAIGGTALIAALALATGAVVFWRGATTDVTRIESASGSVRAEIAPVAPAPHELVSSANPEAVRPSVTVEGGAVTVAASPEPVDAVQPMPFGGSTREPVDASKSITLGGPPREADRVIGAGSVVHALPPSPLVRPAPIAQAPRPVAASSAVSPPSATPQASSADPSAPVNCNPPFFFDSDGIRRFKKECLR